MNNLLVDKNKNLKSIILQLEKNANGLVFIVDKKNKLVGVFSDGDLRRLLLKRNISLNTKISKVMNKKFIYAYSTWNKEKIIATFNKYGEKIKILPLLSKHKIIQDYVSNKRLSFIPIFSPSLNGNELEYVTNCIKTNWISSKGSYVTAFEKKIAKIHKLNYALSVSNGTVAIQLAIKSLNLKKNDEIIVPNLTFAAVANSVINAGCIPRFVDINHETWNIDENKIKKAINKKTRAILIVHTYGNPCNVTKISKIAKENNLFLIEDCAESIGAKHRNKLTGTFGDCSTFSFYGNKTFTTGEGGMILFKNRRYFEFAKILRDHGMSLKKRYYHDFVGHNFRLTNLQSAIGLAQLERFKSINKIKKTIAKRYISGLIKINCLKFQKTLDKCEHSFWAFPLVLKTKIHKQIIEKKLNEYGIETRNFFYPLNIQKPYKKYSKNKNYHLSEDISERGLCLPTFIGLKEYEQKNIINKIKEISKNLN